MRAVRRFACLLAVASAFAVTSAAAAFPAGADLFETDPEATHFAFQGDFALPAGFFDPGSQAFQGQVRFGGVPLKTFGGRDVGDADTVVKRLAPANLGPPFPATDTVPIELVQLSLQSTSPITVTVGGTTQVWDVTAEVSPSARSQGTMTVTKTNDRGGTFDSHLTVTPLFHFTRRTDGVQRFLDLGALRLPAAALDALTLRAAGVPWASRCVDPALAVPGLNDGFCPGLDPDGEKRLTLEQASLAQHGVWPAQPLPNHYKCYQGESQGFRPRSVRLADQFRALRARVLKPLTLCNPVKKNREPIQSPGVHLKCYAIAVRSKLVGRRVAVVNQLGVEVLNVLRPERLCVPSTKRPLGKRPPPVETVPAESHFVCYSVKGRARTQRLTLSDQFDVERVRVVRAQRLCAAARKNAEPVPHPLRHLVCYRIAPLGGPPFRRRVVVVRNQFGVEVVRVLRPETLCIPSVKLPYDGGPPPLPPIPRKPPPTVAADFQLACSPATIKVPAVGGLGQTTCTLTSIGGFAGDVSLSCDETTGARCAFAPSPATLAAGATADVQLQVNGPPAPSGSSTSLTVTATSGAVAHTTQVSLQSS